MSVRRSWTLIGHEARILRHDPLPFILSILLPLVMMWLLRPAFDAMFQALSGSVDGAAQAVPGMAVLYATFLVANVAFGFLREFEWTTWTRLRLAGASAGDLIVSKLVPGFLAVFLLMELLLGGAGRLFGLQVQGSWMAVTLLVVLFSAWLTAAGAVIAGVCHTAAQATAVANLIALACGGLGGVIVPAETLPVWAARIGSVLPTRSVMSGLRDAISGSGVSDVRSQVVALGLWTLATIAVAAFLLGRTVTSEDLR
jgi:ABC-2 type transport system permease protein